MLNLLLGVLTSSRSVVAVRMSPKQKADLAASLRNYNANNVVLAIGDGTNDVGMILQSNVGVSVSSRESTRAESVSDFGISTFSHL
jgi:P-type E1-E2 ATPase